MLNDYFFVFKISNFAEKVLLDEKTSSYIKFFLKLRLKKVKYFETFDVDDSSYVVIGSAYVEKNVKLKVFFLELYAHLKDEKIKPSFKMKEKVINNVNLKMFKISKFKW